MRVRGQKCPPHKQWQSVLREAPTRKLWGGKMRANHATTSPVF